MARQISTDPGKAPCKVLKVGDRRFVYRREFIGSLSKDQEAQFCDSDATETLSSAKGERVLQSRQKLAMLGQISKKCLKSEVSIADFPKCVIEVAGKLKRGKWGIAPFGRNPDDPLESIAEMPPPELPEHHSMGE